MSTLMTNASIVASTRSDFPTRSPEKLDEILSARISAAGLTMSADERRRVARDIASLAATDRRRA